MGIKVKDFLGNIAVMENTNRGQCRIDGPSMMGGIGYFLSVMLGCLILTFIAYDKSLTNRNKKGKSRQKYL